MFVDEEFINFDSPPGSPDEGFFRKFENDLSLDMEYNSYFYSQIFLRVNHVELHDNPYDWARNVTDEFYFLNIDGHFTYNMNVERDENYKALDDSNSVFMRSHYQHRLLGEILFGLGNM